MQPASAGGDGGDTGAMLRRWGPVVAIGAVVVGVLAIVVFGGGDSGDTGGQAASTAAPTSSTATTEPGSTEPGTAVSTTPTTETGPTIPTWEGSPYPPGVMSFEVASDLGLSLDFGERCDTERGRVKVPDVFAPTCWLPFEGDNGGATAPGVTADTIRIAYYESQDSDFILQYLTDAIADDDTNADVTDTMEKLLQFYETYYETYGRRVELIPVVASGVVNDEVSARADAVRIAEEIKPFMVWNGPGLTNAFADELAARGIPCISCGPGQPADYYIANDGLSWTIGAGNAQTNLLVAEYVAERLAGMPASHAGDPDMVSTDRVFGLLYISSSAASEAVADQLEAELGRRGVELAARIPYALDPFTIQETASNAIAKLKDAGVTSVIFASDPISPRDFTREATAQEYFPEWVLADGFLSDTNAFARTYDQDQWAHAFGLTSLAAPVRPEKAGAFHKYTWFHGEEPAANDEIGVIDPFPALFYAALSAVGPDLTIEGFRDALFAAAPTPRAITAPSLSYGSHGRWPPDLEPDYLGVDDVTEIWWDPEAVGPDELRREGAGMYRWVDGGRRYLAGEFEAGPTRAFDPEGAITIYDDRPPAEASPDYEPLPSPR